GATTAVFSVVRGVLLRPLPYRAPDRLVLFRADGPGVSRQALVTGHELAAIKSRGDLFESIGVINESGGNLTEPDQMEAVTAASPSDNFLETLGLKPFLGRMVSRQDIGPQWVTAVDISYELWQRRWQGDPTIVGKPIEINNIPMTIAGVLPPRFMLELGPNVPISRRLDIWFPRGPGYDEGPTRSQTVIARLRGGVSLQTAQAEVNRSIAGVVAAHGADYRAGGVHLSMSSLEHEVGSDVRPALLALTGAVAFVLLVACANLMNLLLARACARTRELAIRAAIGASRRRLVAQLAAEGLLLGVVGAALGLIVAEWSVDGLLRLAPATLPRRDAIAIDGVVAAFAVGTSLLCSLLFGLVPAWHATKIGVVDMIKQDPAQARHAGTTRGLLVAAQLALSLMLLVGAGLMARAFVSMRSQPLGFDPSRALTMQIALQVQRFNAGSLEEAKQKRLAFYHALADSTRQIPGVEQVGIGLFVPMSDGPMTMQFSLGPDQPARPAVGAIALAGFLEALRVPLLAGRYFTPEDDNRLVAIVDRQLADEVWPRESALGRRMLLLRTTGEPTPVDIVGVVNHVQLDGLRARSLPEIFVTYATRQYTGLNIVVRGANPMALAPAVEAAVQRLGPGRPVHDIRLLEDYVADASADTRFALFVLGVFAVLATVLTAIGVYGVAAYATARRTREIAVRLALGADRRRIVGLVVREGWLWTAGGLAAGVAGALLLSQYLRALLFAVGERDPLTFVGVAAVLGAVALLATVVPAINALRVDPMLALRSE
ncbi:MAG TPA: ABC transporter permease, partial [Gemmatimonadaceae bacterium]|nr:ABC transporter permease [Gemmatimonadaceae bacterium]